MNIIQFKHKRHTFSKLYIGFANKKKFNIVYRKIVYEIQVQTEHTRRRLHE